MTRLKHKTVAITGASSGIGEATARLLAAEGANVVLGARRTDRLEALVEEIRAAGGTAEFHTLDVTNLENMQDFIAFARKAYGSLDVLVSNAGLMPLSRYDSLKIDEWNRMIDVNIRGVLHGIAAALPVFNEQKSGQFVNIASIGAYYTFPTAGVYCATKYAVRAMSDALRQESPEYIRVTTVSPGVTESELAGTITDSGAAAYMEEFRAKALPARGIAAAIAYAVSQPMEVDVSELIIRPTNNRV